MPNTITVKSYLYNVSLTTLEEAGIDVGDGGKQEQEMVAQDQAGWLLNRLTNRQRQVALLLQQGYTRREIAEDHLHVCLQAIHQIIPRMRKRLAQRGGVRA